MSHIHGVLKQKIRFTAHSVPYLLFQTLCPNSFNLHKWQAFQDNGKENILKRLKLQNVLNYSPIYKLEHQSRW